MQSYQYPIQVRFRDCDGLCHINNAVYHSYIEAARTAWLDEILQLGVFSKGCRIPIILARTEIDFVSQGHLHDKITVSHHLARIGTKSFHQSYTIQSANSELAKALAVLVWYDFDQNKSIAIPNQFRPKLEQYVAKPE